MDEVLKIVVLGRAARNASGIKNRQPIPEMMVQSAVHVPEYFTDIIADELNVKKVSFKEDVSEYTTYTFKPQLRTVGPKYGKFLGQIRTALAEIDGHAAWEELQKNGSLTLPGVGEGIVLTEDDLLISVAQTEGFATESGNDITVVLDIRLTPELLEEGLVREIISKVQTMRKEAGFEVMDQIRITYQADQEVCSVFAAHKEDMKKDVLAVDIAEEFACRISEGMEYQRTQSRIRSEKSMSNILFDKEAFKSSVKNNVRTLYRKTLSEATEQEIFQAVSYTVKDVIIDQWLATPADLRQRRSEDGLLYVHGVSDGPRSGK